MMRLDALQLIYLRNTFYRVGKRSLILMSVISLLSNIFLAYILYCVIYYPPGPKYFAVDTRGRLALVYPLAEPNITDLQMLDIGGSVIMAAYSYSFADYRKEFQASSDFFTPRGWSLFMKALQDSNNLLAIIDKKWVVSSEAINKAKLLDKGVNQDGVYYWVIEMSILVTYQNLTEFSQQANSVVLTLERVSTLNSPRGFGIAQIVATPLVD